MSAESLTLCDDVVQLIGQSELALDASVQRMYVPDHALENLKQLTIGVYPLDIERSPANRSQTQRLYTVFVAVLKQVKTKELTEIDALMAYVEELAEYLDVYRRDATLIGSARLMEVQNAVLYSHEHLTAHTFFSLIRLKMRVLR